MTSGPKLQISIFSKFRRKSWKDILKKSVNRPVESYFDLTKIILDLNGESFEPLPKFSIMSKSQAHIFLQVRRNSTPLAGVIRPRSIPFLLIAPRVADAEQSDLALVRWDHAHSLNKSYGDLPEQSLDILIRSSQG